MSAEAGAYLQTRFFSRGASQTLDGLMREGTGELLTARYLIEHLREAGSTSRADKRHTSPVS